MEATSVRNAIINLVESNAISGEIVNTYKQHKMVLETRKLADKGDTEAMKSIGLWYKNGLNGIPKNSKKSREWLDKAHVNETIEDAKNSDPNAMYLLGAYHYNG